MSDLVESTAKLQLDPVTGEMVSKGELKKRLKKREKAAGKAAQKATQEAEGSKTEKPAAKKVEDAPIDPEVLFKVGFLAEVAAANKARPVQTRFPPEPNVGQRPSTLSIGLCADSLSKGYLHIGHAKAITVNFGFARYQ